MASQNNGASSPTVSKYVRSLGLPGFRQKRGVSLEQIADKTKISIRFLRAIESEEFEKLPGGLFSTSYIRQYAAAIGFDESELIGQYKEKTAPPEEPGSQAKRKSPSSETRNRFGRWLGIAAEAPRS
ncbi:MAG: helix-turn-helix domain-containing protein [Bryobacteraceae bacterium]